MICNQMRMHQYAAEDATRSYCCLRHTIIGLIECDMRLQQLTAIERFDALTEDVSDDEHLMHACHYLAAKLCKHAEEWELSRSVFYLLLLID